MVIVLVKTQRSMADICEISPSIAIKFAGPVASEARPATLGPLSFAPGPIDTRVDNESEYQRSRALESKCGEGDDVEEDILEVRENHSA